MSGSVVYLLVIISQGASILKLDDCVQMPRGEGRGRVKWWMEKAEYFKFKCESNIKSMGVECKRGDYMGFAQTYRYLDNCKAVSKARLSGRQ